VFRLMLKGPACATGAIMAAIAITAAQALVLGLHLRAQPH
jgi:hypothetical protein